MAMVGQDDRRPRPCTPALHHRDSPSWSCTILPAQDTIRQSLHRIRQRRCPDDGMRLIGSRSETGHPRTMTGPWRRGQHGGSQPALPPWQAAWGSWHRPRRGSRHRGRCGPEGATSRRCRSPIMNRPVTDHEQDDVHRRHACRPPWMTVPFLWRIMAVPARCPHISGRDRPGEDHPMFLVIGCHLSASVRGLPCAPPNRPARPAPRP